MLKEEAGMVFDGSDDELCFEEVASCMQSICVALDALESGCSEIDITKFSIYLSGEDDKVSKNEF